MSVTIAWTQFVAFGYGRIGRYSRFYQSFQEERLCMVFVHSGLS